ncbi:hypothetical protein RhiirA4_521455 [Rhizophagus irregularis]|uniref:Transposase domain-containing protein n=1 Tax=Rhizophagus irregularis TaxID=588596 RepID=A0A2I1HQQ5_9GLOM|nr:hypothetical protein RhiirA4_521455 [Rhizophagus irregularis]
MASQMYAHWTGKFFNNIPISNDYELSKSQWEIIGAQMKKIKKDMPNEIGRPPQDILKYHNSYKAVEWRNWIILFSLLLLRKYLDKRFVVYFREYYQHNSQRLAACRISFHYLLHVANCIKYCGPSWTHWQFPMERICGILQPLIKSRLNPYSNLSNTLTLLQQFYLLPFFSISKSIFKEKLPKQWNSKQNINNYGMKYGRLRTSDGHYISSHWIKRKNKIARNNYCVQIRRTIDKVSHRPNALPQLMIVDIYGIVDYFFVHKFNDKIHMLAYVQLTSKIIDDEYECKYFTQFKSKEFIDVRCVDHCVGFAKIDNKYFIIDKENAFDDANWENLE